MSWTDERVEMLKKLWADGLSASQIAAKLGGVSRNAVIGKVHRLKLSGRAKSTKSAAPKIKRPSAPRTNLGNGGGGGARTNAYGSAMQRGGVRQGMAATALKQDADPQALVVPDTRPIEDVVVPIAKRLMLTELNENTCKWPYGDPLTDEFYFCGHGTDDGSPYCKYHGKLAFQQNDRKRAR
ncbi:GcrA family cell cycle regulator [Oceaniradius stylonematis]|uniref:GcrA family cell cycle regulator n=1 Tax=Oceaniradius stylonematis TaxID=2184161 RepID=UPI000F3E45AA|nr:GcrA family cell cycle regulator [Oceaniradius stylonematis]RNC97083.1 MAG: GcrA cell cycle regulator [Oricola sp.]